MIRDFTAKDIPVYYWSDSCGELHYHGEYELIEEELPRILRDAYKKYWGEDYPLLCYLGEIEEEFRLLFILEVDEESARDFYHCDFDSSFTVLRRLAERLERYSAFSCADFILGKKTGSAGCHELIISVPASIERETFECFVKALEDHF